MRDISIVLSSLKVSAEKCSVRQPLEAFMRTQPPRAVPLKTFSAKSNEKYMKNTHKLVHFSGQVISCRPVNLLTKNESG